MVGLFILNLLQLFFLCSAKHCRPWIVAAHARISTAATSCGTVATVSCDDGFVFPDGRVSVAIECTVATGDVTEVVWNVTEFKCQRKSSLLVRSY